MPVCATEHSIYVYERAIPTYTNHSKQTKSVPNTSDEFTRAHNTSLNMILFYFIFLLFVANAAQAATSPARKISITIRNFF